MNRDLSIEDLPESDRAGLTDLVFFARPAVGNFNVQKGNLLPLPTNQVRISQPSTSVNGVPIPARLFELINLFIPSDMITLNSVKIQISFSAAPFDINVNTIWAGNGAAFNANTGTVSFFAVPNVIGQIYNLDITAALPAIAAGSVVGVKVDQFGFLNFKLWGAEISYSRI